MGAPKGHPPYPGCEKGGRPRKYSPQDIEHFADEFLQWMERVSSIWYEDFCLEHDIDPDLLSEWSRENEKFSGVYRRAKVWQKNKLIRGGLLSEFNPSFTKFVMANTCGWTDKQQISGDAANPLSFLLGSIDGKSKDLIDEQE